MPWLYWTQIGKISCLLTVTRFAFWISINNCSFIGHRGACFCSKWVVQVSWIRRASVVAEWAIHYNQIKPDQIIWVRDSSGRFSQAILKGHLYFAGHYSECVQVDAQLTGRDRRFKADYFRYSYSVFWKYWLLQSRCGHSFSTQLKQWFLCSIEWEI